ncbi:DUF2461 domain-containing protein [Corynebacterium macclintockiae]|uniref:DUF2461 domain-containing protein n=1 Tax=Corynebacterium macclintockiae TaxID=2913501 RepID=UPI003EB9A0C8
MTQHNGLPTGFFEFFEDLDQDNTREFWTANRKRWERDVRQPMQALVTELSERFEPLRMFRPHRDLRFAKDAAPYKTWTGATSTRDSTGGIGYYLEASPTGVVTGYGAMRMTPEQLRRFRSAIDDHPTGTQFQQIVDDLNSHSLELTPGADTPLKTAPRGYPAEHPRIHHLRWKGAAVIQHWPRADWIHTHQLADEIATVWETTQPLRDWLERNVHPQQL